MLTQGFSMHDEFTLGEADDDFEGVSMEELNAFRRYLKKSKIQKKRLYAAG